MYVDIAFTWQYNAQIGTDPQGKQPSIMMFNIGSSVYGDWDGERGGGYFRPGGWFSWNIEEYLPGINAPILIIQGENDNYGTIAQVETIAENAGGISEIKMLAECGHSPHKDREDTVLEAMKRFIKKILKT